MIPRSSNDGAGASRQDRIAQRAYEIWEQSGRPHGQDHAHWFQAESELASAATTAPITPPMAAREPRRQTTPPPRNRRMERTGNGRGVAFAR
jgi:hypothetical protein